MTETTRPTGLDAETQEFAQQIADQVESFLIALKAVAREGDGGRAISLLLLETSQVLLAGARLGAQRDFTPTFTVVQMVKDLGLILDAGAAQRVPLPQTALTLQLMHAALAHGDGDADYAAIIKAAERAAGLEMDL